MSAAEPMYDPRYPVVEPLEWSDKKGAAALKEKIEAYWRERGHDVECRLETQAYLMSMRYARVDVRSNLINGMPRALYRSLLPSPEQNQ